MLNYLKNPVPFAFAALSGALGFVMAITAQKAIGQAWDNGYKTGRKAEREDWNYPN